MQTCEKEYDFTLVLAGIADLTTEVEDALFEAGCNDAALGMRDGRVYLTFTRKAVSLKDAVLSAIRDVRKAEIGVEVLRLDCADFVTPSDKETQHIAIINDVLDFVHQRQLAPEVAEEVFQTLAVPRET